LVSSGLEATEQLVLEIDAKMRGYDETSTDRLKKAETDIKTNADKIALLDGAATHVTEQINNIITTNITINETIHEMSKKTEDNLNDLQNKVKSLEEGNKNAVEKLVSMEEHQYVQNEKVMYIQTLNEKVNKIDEERQESAEKVKKDLDGLVEKNTKAIDDLKKEYEKSLNSIMTANLTINENFNGIHIKTEQAWQSLEDLKNKQNLDISNVNNNLDIEKKRIDNIIDEFKEISDEIDNNKSDIKKNFDRLNELDNVNSNLSSKIDGIADGDKNRDDQIRDMELRITSNTKRIDSLETETKAVLIKANASNEHLGKLDKTVEDLCAKQNETDGKLEVISTLTNKIELNVKNYEQELDKKSSNDINDIRVQLEGLKSDVGTNDRKIDEVKSGNQATEEKILAFQQDVEGKINGLSENDKILFTKIDGLEHDNIQKNEKIQNIQDNYQNNIEKLVQIEEQTHMQAEKVHYVEMLSDRVNQIDDQRQKNEAKIKDDVDESFAKNSKAIEEMKKQFEGMLSEVEKQREIEQESLKSESDSLSLLINNLQSEGNMQKTKIQELMEDKLKLEDELEEAKKVSKNFQNTGENLKDSLDKYQSMLEGKLKEVEELKIIQNY
jgi:chromosome segregation ATPase